MSFFKEDQHFDPKNLDTWNLQGEMEFYDSLYQAYSYQALIENDKDAEKRAIMAHAISETIKAILCLCIDGSNIKLFDSILDKMCPKMTKQ